MAEQTPTTREQLAKDQLAKDKEARQRIVDETTAKTEGVKPTPTQEENDRARMGEDVAVKEDDGSGPEVTPLAAKQQAQKGDKGETEKPAGSYPTRQQTAKPPASSS